MSERGFKRIARRRYNDLDVLAQSSFWGLIVGFDFSLWAFVGAFVAWFVFMAISVQLESIYFPEYSPGYSKDHERDPPRSS